MSLRLEDIQAFLNVVELGSISAAAERMSLSKSVISKRVSDVLQLDDRIVDFEKEGYDLAIRITRLQDSSLIARQLGTSRRVVCCSPEYLERHGPLQRIEDILCHPCIGYSHNTPSQLWSFEPRVAGEPARMITPRGRFNTNNGQTMRDAAVRGLGLAMLPLFIAAEDLAAGRLVEALPQERPLDDLIYAMYSRAATLSPKVKLFVQFLQQALGSPPWGVR